MPRIFIRCPLELPARALVRRSRVLRAGTPPFRRVELEPEGIAPPAQRQGERAQQDVVKKSQERPGLEIPDLLAEALPLLPQNPRQSGLRYLRRFLHLCLWAARMITPRTESDLTSFFAPAKRILLFPRRRPGRGRPSVFRRPPCGRAP